MNYLFSILFSLLLHPYENFTANSIDWLCYDSPTICLVKFNSYKLEHKAFLDYPDRYIINTTIVKNFKGSAVVNDPITIYFSLNSKFEDEWNSMVNKEVFLFLKTISVENKMVYWAWDSEMGIINLSNPEDEAITGNFDILKDMTSIEDYIKICLEKLKGKTANRAFFAAPHNNRKFVVNLEGIYVPDILYPNAKKDLD